MQTSHLLCLFFDLVSVSTSWVLRCEPKAIRDQFVLFRKHSKTIANDIFKITTKRKNNNSKKKLNAAGNSLFLGSVCSVNYYEGRAPMVGAIYVAGWRCRVFRGFMVCGWGRFLRELWLNEFLGVNSHSLLLLWFLLCVGENTFFYKQSKIKQSPQKSLIC